MSCSHHYSKSGHIAVVVIDVKTSFNSSSSPQVFMHILNFMYSIVSTVESKLTELPTILDLLTIDNLMALCKNLKNVYNSSKQKTVEALIKHSNSYRPIFGSKSAGSVVIKKWVSFMAYSWDIVVDHKQLCESV